LISSIIIYQSKK